MHKLDKTGTSSNNTHSVQNFEGAIHGSGAGNVVNNDVNSTPACVQRPLHDVLLVVLLVPVHDVIAAVILSREEFVDGIVGDEESDAVAEIAEEQLSQSDCPQAQTSATHDKHIDARCEQKIRQR